MSPEARPGREDREPREPWRSFLLDLGSRLSGPLDLHCIGGFAVTQMYGISRATADIDVLPALPGHQLAELRTLAGEGTELHRRHGIYIEPVTVVTYPVEYHTRLERLWPGFAPEVLRLWVLEPHDLALTKLERNQDVDRQDVQELTAKLSSFGWRCSGRRTDPERPFPQGRCTRGAARIVYGEYNTTCNIFSGSMRTTHDNGAAQQGTRAGPG